MGYADWKKMENRNVNVVDNNEKLLAGKEEKWKKENERTCMKKIWK